MLVSALMAATGVVGRAVTVGEGALLLEVESSGVDCYADGVRAVDGEYYALVAIAPRVQFAGFAADGSLVDGENARVLFRRPLAKDGRCPKTSVAIDEAAVASGERLLLALLDTRAMVRSGAAFRVDGWLGGGRRTAGGAVVRFLCDDLREFGGVGRYAVSGEPRLVRVDDPCARPAG